MTIYRTELCFVLAIGVFLVALAALGLLYYDYSATLIRFPLLAAGITFAVLIAHLLLMHRRSAALAEQPPEAAPSALARALGASQRGRTLIRLLCVSSVVPLVFLLGYPLGLAAYLLTALKYFGESWPLSVAIAGASLAVSYGLFIQTLGVSLPIFPAWWPVVVG